MYTDDNMRIHCVYNEQYYKIIKLMLVTRDG